jgi:hypothetical protein
MAELGELLKRIDRLSSRASGTADDAQLLSEIEDLLGEGYAQALNAEARSRRLGERLERLVEIIDEPGAAVEIRRITVQRRSLDQRTAELRGRLSVLREHFVRLGGGRSVRG